MEYGEPVIKPPPQMSATSLQTSRLLLRPWQKSDLPAFAELNADPQVMQHLPKLLTRTESDELAARISAHLAEHHFGLWAVEVPDVSPFIGFVGLSIPRFEADFTPCVEVGWRIARPHWNQGYATEAAIAVIAHGFNNLALTEIVSFTVPQNQASRRVMQKLGMTHDRADDFDHPSLPKNHPLNRHVLYRINQSLAH